MQTRQYVPATVSDTRTILLGRNRLSSLATPPALAAKLAARPATEGTVRDFRAATAPVRTVSDAARTTPVSPSHYVRKTANSPRPAQHGLGATLSTPTTVGCETGSEQPSGLRAGSEPPGERLLPHRARPLPSGYIPKVIPAPANTARPGNQHPRLK
jgi:hypothetical protein